MKTYDPYRTLQITQGQGKMEGIPSLNTSSLTNPFCQDMSAHEGTVCSKCYSSRLLHFRRALSKRCDKNGIILESSGEIWIPPINSLYFRFHSFGELINMGHLEHLHDICLDNRDTMFSLWTKRVDFIWYYLDEFAKPENLVLVYSEELINPISPQIPLGFDHVYAVYDKTSPVEINCPEKCIDCLRCYQKETKEIVRARLK